MTDVADVLLLLQRGSDGDEQQQLRSQQREVIQFMYESKTGNIFTKENLQAIYDNDQKFFASKKFREDFCLLVNGACAKPRSVIRFFDGTYSISGAVFWDPNFDNIDAVMNAAQNNDETKPLLEFIMPSKYEINNTTVKADIVRTSFAIGWPLRGYENDEDDDDDQQDDTAEYLNDYISDAQKLYEDGVGDDLNFFYFSDTMYEHYVTNKVYHDMALLGGSLLFLFLFMWLQTRSLFITGLAILSIYSSFFVANILYRFVFGFRHFGIFHVLALFIIFGIGSDGVFVFYDKWRESSHYPFPSLAHRMSFVYRRAALAMLWTSLTTAVAFIVSGTSPFLGVNTFGVFAGILVLVNYLSVITYLPCVIIVYHLYFEKFCCCCCCANKTVEDKDEPTVPVDRQNQGFIVRFFHNQFYHFITHKIARWVILACYAALLGTFIYFATTMEVQEEQVLARRFCCIRMFVVMQRLHVTSGILAQLATNMYVYLRVYFIITGRMYM